MPSSQIVKPRTVESDAPTKTDVPPRLERDAARSVRWTGAAHAARQGLTLVTTLLLTRLLLPADFGLAAIVMIAVAFVELVQDFGLSSALVQRKEVGRRLVSSVFWFNIAVGVVAGCAVCVGAPWLCAWAGDDRLASLLIGAALLFVLRGAAFLPRSELARRLDFATLSRAELVAAVAGAVCAVGAALAGAGVWALLVQPLVGSSLLAIALWRRATWRPRLEFAWAEIASVRRYSTWLTAHHIVDFLQLYGAHVLIAYALQAERLGIYYLALRITTFPAGAVSASISRVLFPYLARVIDDRAYASKSYLSIARAIGLCAFPAVVGFAVVADLFFAVVCGPEWRDCAVVAALLTPVGLSRAIASTTGPIYQAKGQTDVLFRRSCYYVVVVLTALAIGAPWGVEGVAAAYSATVLFSYPLYSAPMGMIGVTVRDLVSVLAKPLALCAAMALAVLGQRALLDPILPPPMALAMAIFTGLTVYGCAAALFAAGELRSVWQRLRPPASALAG